MTTPSIQKALESFEERYNASRESFRGTMSPQDIAFIKSFLTTALEEISDAAYREGCEDTLKQTDPDHKACYQEVEKVKLVWSDIGYRNGLEEAKKCVLGKALSKMVDGTECRNQTLAALDSLLNSTLQENKTT